MSTINWKPGLILKIDTNSVRDYTVDWTTWLSGQTIASLTITELNCSAVQSLLTATHLTFRVSNVLADARVTFRVTTNLGQVEDFSIIFLLETR